MCKDFLGKIRLSLRFWEKCSYLLFQNFLTTVKYFSNKMLLKLARGNINLLVKSPENCVLLQNYFEVM